MVLKKNRNVDYMENRMVLIYETFRGKEFTIEELVTCLGIPYANIRNIITYMTYRLPIYEYCVKGIAVFGFLEEDQDEILRDPATIPEKKWAKRIKDYDS